MFSWFKQSRAAQPTFTWLNKQGVRSSSGFEVQFTGRFTAEYREGSKKISLSIESGLSDGKPSISVGAKAFERWDGSSPETSIAVEKQTQIQTNLRMALEFQGLILIVDSPATAAQAQKTEHQMYVSWLRMGKQLTINGRQIRNESELDECFRERDET